MSAEGKIRHWDSPSKQQRRERVEAELSAIPALDPTVRRLISADGFADYFLNMQDLYPSHREAYERLEDFHISVTGRRRYAEFDSFRTVLGRYLNACQRGKPKE